MSGTDFSDDASAYDTPLHSPVKEFQREVVVEQVTQGVHNSNQGQQREAVSFLNDIVQVQAVSSCSQLSSCSSLSSDRLKCLLPNCETTVKDIHCLTHSSSQQSSKG